MEWSLSEGMQVSALPPVWIAMIISCWSVKRLKLPSVTLTHVCGTNSHNWWATGLPGVGVVKIFCDSESDSLGWKSFRLLDSDSTTLWSTPCCFVYQTKVCVPDLLLHRSHVQLYTIAENNDLHTCASHGSVCSLAVATATYCSWSSTSLVA